MTADDFSINIDDITPFDAKFTISTSDPSIVYTYGVLTKVVYDDIVQQHGSKYKADLAWWEYAGDQGFLADISEGVTTSSIGEENKVAMPDDEYIIYCYAVDKETRELASPIVEKTFYTAKSIPSDNKIEFIEEKVTPTAIYGQIKTTNNYGYYISVQKKSYVNQFIEQKEAGELIDGKDPILTMFINVNSI